MPVEMTLDGGIARVTLSNPGRKNAISIAMFQQLGQLFRDLGEDPSVRVVLVSGDGSDFSSGADLADTERRRGHWLNHVRWVAGACVALNSLPMPCVAKVRGVAAGAGANLALGCDLVVASETARFSEIFVNRGMSLDFGGSYVLPRRVGMHKAKELAFFGDVISSADAMAIGIVNKVVADGQLDEAVEDWIGRLAAAPPLALSMTKRLLNGSLTSTLEQALEAESVAQALNFTTSDTREALQAFRERRAPSFNGR
jgi:enoyl-CoA hydratase/carnithine racemase